MLHGFGPLSDVYATALNDDRRNLEDADNASRGFDKEESHEERY